MTVGSFQWNESEWVVGSGNKKSVAPIYETISHITSIAAVIYFDNHSLFSKKLTSQVPAKAPVNVASASVTPRSTLSACVLLFMLNGLLWLLISSVCLPLPLPPWLKWFSSISFLATDSPNSSRMTAHVLFCRAPLLHLAIPAMAILGENLFWLIRMPPSFHFARSLTYLWCLIFDVISKHQFAVPVYPFWSFFVSFYVCVSILVVVFICGLYHPHQYHSFITPPVSAVPANAP